MTTMGGIIGPVGTFFILLHSFVALGFFDPELDSGLTVEDLTKG